MLYEKTDTCYFVLPEFGKQKLITYAESLEELSQSYLFSTTEAEEDGQADEPNRSEQMLTRKLDENRAVISKQLAQVSDILKRLAGEAYYTSKSMERHKKQIHKVLNENGLEIKDIYAVENRNGYLEIGITMRAYYKEDIFETKDIAKFLSKLCHNKMRAGVYMPQYVKEDFVTIVFREEVRYLVTTGVAKATKAGEIYSGDNYTQTELNCGTYLATISDGMGSGFYAGRDSLMVIELMEQFLEAGLHTKEAISMINDLLLVKMAEPRTATLDIMRLNLYSGECHFLKIGAAVSFVIRKDKVETIMSCSMPLGLFPKTVDSIEPSTVDLKGGDVIVMVSDGVTDSIAGTQAEKIIAGYLREYNFISCKDLANHILGMAIGNGDGHIQDDMTVLVMQIEEV